MKHNVDVLVGIDEGDGDVVIDAYGLLHWQSDNVFRLDSKFLLHQICRDAGAVNRAVRILAIQPHIVICVKVTAA